MAKATARADAANALAAARVATLWLSDDDAQRVDDMFSAFGLLKESAARARVLFRRGDSAGWRHAIRDMLAARADVAAGNSVALSRGDAQHKGRIYASIAAHVTRWNRGEKNAHLLADGVEPADVWQRAAELCIRDGATIGGMPTYGGMISRHKSAAADLRRDALAARRGYVTLSLSDDATAGYADALAARGYVHIPAPRAIFPDVETLAKDAARVWFPNADGMHDESGRPTLAAHRAAMADAHRSHGDDANAVALAARVTSLALMADYESADMSDDARMGKPVVSCIAHGMTFDEIRVHYTASDAVLIRYALAYADAVAERKAAIERATRNALIADAARRAHRADTHVCDTRAGVFCAPCTALFAWLMPMRARRIARATSDAPVWEDMTDARTYGKRAGRIAPADALSRYAASPLASVPEYRPTDGDRAFARDAATASADAASAILAAAETRCAEILATATDAKAAGKRCKRIRANAEETASAVRSLRASRA